MAIDSEFSENVNRAESILAPVFKRLTGRDVDTDAENKLLSGVGRTCGNILSEIGLAGCVASEMAEQLIYKGMMPKEQAKTNIKKIGGVDRFIEQTSKDIKEGLKELRKGFLVELE